MNSLILELEPCKQINIIRSSSPCRSISFDSGGRENTGELYLQQKRSFLQYLANRIR